MENVQLDVFYDSTGMIALDGKLCEGVTDIGLRQEQEDRMVMCPKFGPSGQSSLFCVFDGTCGDHASEFTQKNFPRTLLSNESFVNILKRMGEGEEDKKDELLEGLTSVFQEVFAATDAALLEECRLNQRHYAASTGVVAFICGNMLTVSHVGDSKACIARLVDDSTGELECEELTLSHKPNQPEEQQRIEQQGGALVYLHGDKPYIRGGDFRARQKTGERPKQLNYSRAFGGKDLKTFGLSCHPDVTHVEITSSDRLVLVGSDGLFDVLTPFQASSVAFEAFKAGMSPCRAVVKRAIREMPSCNVRDNITVVAIFLNADHHNVDFGPLKNEQEPVNVLFPHDSSSPIAATAECTNVMTATMTNEDENGRAERHVFSAIE